MAYIHICDICKQPILLDNYTSILVERPQDRCQIAFHDATKYELCDDCFLKVKRALNIDTR